MDNNENPISLIELCWNVVLHWRSLLIGAVLGAMVVGCAVYFRDMKAYDLTMDDAITTESPYDFSEEENIQIQDAIMLQNMILELKEHRNNSVLMNMDSGKRQILQLRYYVNANIQKDEKDYSLSLANAYVYALTNADLSEQIVQELNLNIEPVYISELVKSYYDSSSLFFVEISYQDPETLKKMGVVVDNWIKSQTEQLSQQIGIHSIELLSENLLNTSNADILNTKLEYQTTLADYEQRLAEASSAMTEKQANAVKAYFKSNDSMEGILGAYETPVLQISWKYVILGAAAAVTLLIIWYIFSYILSGKIHDTAELTEIYRLNLLGILQSNHHKGIDQLLLRIKNRRRKQINNEDWLQIIVSKIELVCHQKALDKIYLTGSEFNKINIDFVNALEKKLSDRKISLSYGNNICYDISSLHNAIETGYAIFIEQINVSSCKEIKYELMTLTEKAVPVIGCIVVE